MPTTQVFLTIVKPTDIGNYQEKSQIHEIYQELRKPSGFISPRLNNKSLTISELILKQLNGSILLSLYLESIIERELYLPQTQLDYITYCHGQEKSTYRSDALRYPLNQVVDVEQTKEIIKEKLNKQTVGNEEKIKQQLNRLRTFQSNMYELRQQLFMNIASLVECLNHGLMILIIQLRRIILIQQKDSNYLMKIYLGFKKLLNIEGIQKCYEDLKQINYEWTAQSFKHTRIIRQSYNSTVDVQYYNSHVKLQFIIEW